MYFILFFFLPNLTHQQFLNLTNNWPRLWHEMLKISKNKLELGLQRSRIKISKDVKLIKMKEKLSGFLPLTHYLK